MSDKEICKKSIKSDGKVTVAAGEAVRTFDYEGVFDGWSCPACDVFGDADKTHGRQISEAEGKEKRPFVLKDKKNPKKQGKEENYLPVAGRGYKSEELGKKWGA